MAKKYVRQSSNIGKRSSRVGLSVVLALALAGGGYAGYRLLTDEEEEEAQQLQYASLSDCVADWGDESLCQLSDDDKIHVQATGTPAATGSTSTSGSSHTTHRTYYSPWYVVRGGSYFYSGHNDTGNYANQPARGNVATHNSGIVSGRSGTSSTSNTNTSSSSTIGKSSTGTRSSSSSSISRGGFGSSAKSSGSSSSS
ncbi:MAG: DUF1190 domain-containing protein [Anaerolineae bacterium]|nr:DUF1190 domain-containing protein [Anaerolineae bacterium]